MVMTNRFKLNVGKRTRILNVFRRTFKFKPFEKLLARKIRSGSPDSFWVRLAPPNYLYPKNSRRCVVRAGIKYDLDLSDFIEHWAYFGATEPSHERLFQLAENKRVLIDVGVNMGAILLNFAKVAPNGIVFGFEPDDKNYRKAQRNLALNKINNVTIIKKGLGDQNLSSKLFKVNDDNEGMNRIFDDANDTLFEGLSFEEIQVIKLDDFVEERGLSGLDLMKIDVEGYELKVLRGAISTIGKYHPTMFIELDDNNLKAQNDSANLLIEFLESEGYRVYRADTCQTLSSSNDYTDCHFDVIAESDHYI